MLRQFFIPSSRRWRRFRVGLDKSAPKSWQTITVPSLQVRTQNGVTLRSYEHPWLIRLLHWLMVGTFFAMAGSGLEILAAFPMFGSKLPEKASLTVPSSLRLGGWLGGGLNWHLTFASVWIAVGVVYLTSLWTTGRWRMTLIQRAEFTGILPMAKYYLRIGSKPPSTQPYNPLQKAAYTTVITLAAILVGTGILLYKPVQFSGLVWLLGGFSMVRLWHFLAMVAIIAFLPGHLLMVALHGWNSFRSMWTGWNHAPEYVNRENLP